MPTLDSPARPTAHASTGRPFLSDLLASLVVFMVALPLCIAIAKASGMPAQAGLITGIIGGLFVGLISGSPLQVSGPAAGLIVLILDIGEKHGAESIGVVVFLGGVMQLLAGILRLGPWFRAVSPAVIGGMLAGIGIIILSKQFHVLVDDDPPTGVIEGLYTIPLAIWKVIVPPENATANHQAAGLTGMLTILLLLLWKQLAPGRLRLIPAAVVAVVLTVTLSEILRLPTEKVLITGSIMDSVRAITLPDWHLLTDLALLETAVALAIIASAETLLCAAAVDSMHTGPRTRYNRELGAQGIGNMVCGALGALPMTGVIVRSAANVEAGARSRWSAVLHGAWLLGFVALIPNILNLVPIACLAGILVYTGYKLIDWRGWLNMWHESRAEAGIYIATAVMIVCTDLLMGVIVGVVLSIAKLTWTFSHLSIRRVEDAEKKRVHLFLTGAATFLRMPQLAEELDSVPPEWTLHVHLEQLDFIDHATLKLLTNWSKRHEATGGSLVIDWPGLHARFHAARRGQRPAEHHHEKKD